MDKFYCNNVKYQITSLVYSDGDVWTGLDNSFEIIKQYLSWEIE